MLTILKLRGRRILLIEPLPTSKTRQQPSTQILNGKGKPKATPSLGMGIYGKKPKGCFRVNSWKQVKLKILKGN